MEDWKRPVNKYAAVIDASGTSVDIDIHVPQLRAENLHFQTWGSARILAGQLHTIPLSPETFHPPPSSDKDGRGAINILELGAGTGLAGLAAAAIWRTSVVLTDLAPFVPGLALNITANTNALTTRGAFALSGALDWNTPSTLPIFREAAEGKEVVEERTYHHETDKARVIVAADVLYSEDHPRMLVEVIAKWLHPGPEARVVVCYPLRVAYLDIIRDLWALLEETGLEVVTEGKEEIRDRVWDDERLHEWGVWKWRAAER